MFLVWQLAVARDKHAVCPTDRMPARPRDLARGRRAARALRPHTAARAPVGGGVVSHRTHGGRGGVVSHRYAHVGEHGGRARERHHERWSAHRRRLARVRPGGECDLGGLSRTGVFDDEWGGTRAAGVVYDSWR